MTKEEARIKYYTCAITSYKSASELPEYVIGTIEITDQPVKFPVYGDASCLDDEIHLIYEGYYQGCWNCSTKVPL